MIENSLKIKNYKPRREVGKPTVSSALKILALLVVLLVFPLSASASARLQMPPNYLTTGSGLVGYWTFDGKDTNWGTNKTNDLSGQGNTGTLTSMSTTTSPAIGKIGQGLKFSNAAQSEVLTTFTQQLNDFTACAWFYVNNADVLTNNYQRIIDKAYDTGFWMGHQGGGGASDQWGGGVISGTYIFVTLATNQWHHLCSKRSGTTLTIIGDGGSVTNTVTVSGAALSTIPLRIASSYNAPINDALTGKVDDVRIYNRALSAGEVLNLYNIGKAKANVSNAVISNGLVGYWTFDGATTTWSSATAGITGDLSGNFNTGTLTNMNRATSPVVGKIGQGLKFDGANDYVQVASFMSGLTTFSVSVWVKTTQSSTPTNDYDSPAIFGTNQGGGTSQDFMLLNRTGNFYWFDEFGAGENSFASGVTISDNRWHHIIAVRSTTSLTFYIDGVSVGTDTTGSSGVRNDWEGIGYAPFTAGGTSQFFNGSIDDVRIYNRALSAGEVAQLYQQGAAKVNKSPTSLLTSGLVGYWTFDGATTTWSSATAGITGDLSGNFNTGTLTNMNRATSPAIGKIGQGLKFDGVGTAVNVAGSASFNFSGNASISAWIKVASHNGGYRRIVHTGSNRLFLLLNTANKIALATSGTEYDNGFAYTADNKWHLVTGTFNGTSCFVYLDGAFQTSYACGAILTGNNSVRIGAFDGVNQEFTGGIDDVRIYNRALSASEVLQLYNIGR